MDRIILGQNGHFSFHCVYDDNKYSENYLYSRTINGVSEHVPFESPPSTTIT